MNEKRVEELLHERGDALDEPVLSERVEARLRAELAAEMSAASLPFWRKKSVLLSAAAAVLALVVGYSLQRPRPIELQIATLESAALIAEHRTIHGLDATRLPDLDRSSNPDAPTAQDVVTYADEAEGEAVQRALAAGAIDREATWFKIAFRPEVACSAVVFQIDPQGALTQTYPDEAGRGFLPNRFEADRAYVLPRPSIELIDTPDGPAYDYERGFLRPRSVDSVLIVFGLRRDALDEGFDAALVRFQAELASREEPGSIEARAQRLEDWLEESGFSVRRLTVRGSL